jgi:4'-phosphopantetheinyl transferase
MNTLLQDKSIHIWYADIHSIRLGQELIHTTLSPDEIAHANQYKFEQDRMSFFSRHYILRLILSKYYKCRPQELKFRYSQYGKPDVDSSESECLKFNLSFSGNLMAVGISAHIDIGVDLEEIKQLDNINDIANDHFSLEEFTFFKNDSDITSTFYKIWTRKEAFIKGVGKGMFYPLKSFSVKLGSKGVSKHPIIISQPKESKKWRIIELDAKKGYVASLAAKTDQLIISYYQYENYCNI